MNIYLIFLIILRQKIVKITFYTACSISPFISGCRNKKIPIQFSLYQDFICCHVFNIRSSQNRLHNLPDKDSEFLLTDIYPIGSQISFQFTDVDQMEMKY